MPTTPERMTTVLHKYLSGEASLTEEHQQNNPKHDERDAAKLLWRGAFFKEPIRCGQCENEFDLRQRFYVSGLFKCKGCGPADRSHDAGDADEQTHFEISPDDQILRRIGDQDEEAHCDRLHGQHEDHRQRRAEEEVFHTEHESGLPHCQRCDGEKEPANNTDPGGFIREEGQQLAASDTGFRDRYQNHTGDAD